MLLFAGTLPTSNINSPLAGVGALEAAPFTFAEPATYSNPTGGLSVTFVFVGVELVLLTTIEYSQTSPAVVIFVTVDFLMLNAPSSCTAKITPVGTPVAESPPTIVGGNGVVGSVPGGPDVAGADVEISVATALAGAIGAPEAEYV